MPAVPVGPTQSVNPIGTAAAGSKHQVIAAPSQNSQPPSHFSPVPVASVLEGGVTGMAYSETISVQGGSSPYTFSVSSGSLPTSLSLNSSTGAITGTPTAAGTFTFTVKVTDSLGYTGSQAFTIVIAAPAAGGGAYTFVC